MITTHSEDGPGPRVFISYSWDNTEHTNWVLQLATRLRGNGVDVVLDRWDKTLGSDLSLFMERAADTDYRVIAVCTARYVGKADAAEGGVGYERKMITPSLMADLQGNRVVPVLRANPIGALPRFLGAAKYVDLRDQPYPEAAYYELLQDLHGLEPSPKPLLGRNPFTAFPPEEAAAALRNGPARYIEPSLEGTVTFNYENNNGQFVIGAGERSFTLDFGTAGSGIIYVLSDPHNIKSVALAQSVTESAQVGDASSYDASSRVRAVRVGDAVIVRNASDYWAAVFIDQVDVRDTGPTGEPQVTFRYSIPPVPKPNFENDRGA